MMFIRELRRNPRPFLVPVGVLMLLAVMLLYPSAILDGILHGSTGALRTAPADLVVYSREANGVQTLSQLDDEARAAVEAVDGVAQVAAFDSWIAGATLEDKPETYGLALLASEASLGGAFPQPGEAIVDSSLRGEGLREGSLVRIGSANVPVTVVGFVPDLTFWLLPGAIVDKSTWDEVTDLQALAAVSGAPADLLEGLEELPEGFEVPEGFDLPAEGLELPEGAELPEGLDPADLLDDVAAADLAATGDEEEGGAEGQDGTSQLLLVDLEEGADRVAVGAAIDRATDGLTQTFTKQGAIQAMPGVEEQQTTFDYIRFVTLTVALVVVGLFIMFLTLERTPFYAVLKAVGASSRQIFFGVVAQALLITMVAVALGTAATWGLTHIPLELPTMMQPSRLLETLATLGSTTIIGSLLSLRRVARIDPAKAIG